MPTSANAFDPAALLAFDREHVWHPYTSALSPLTAYEATATSGCRIHLRDGRSLVDGMASWWCAIHGYNHPRLIKALRLQAESMPHVMFGGLTHAPAVHLAERLLRLAPPGLQHVFFADSGSVAVEVAMKMALQYQRAGGKPGKSAFLTVRGGYHGDTLGAMSVCDPETGMHSLFRGTLPVQHFAPRPACPFDAPAAEVDLADLERLFADHAEHAAAFIIEPIIQGAGGMWMYHPRYLARAGELCREYDCLLILDEIATGFGRTGRLFACEWAQAAPDILCLGKALTGGVMTLAATLTTRRVAEGISADGGALMHGPTFMGNPLACAVALASLELLEEEDWKTRVQAMEGRLRQGLSACRNLPGVADARALGAVGVLEMEAPVNVERLQAFFIREHSVWIRPFGKLIYIMPAYGIAPEELGMLLRAMQDAVERGVWR